MQGFDNSLFSTSSCTCFVCMSSNPYTCLTLSFSSSFLAGSKVWWGRYELANQTLHWVAEISLSVSQRWSWRREHWDFGPSSLALLLGHWLQAPQVFSLNLGELWRLISPPWTCPSTGGFRPPPSCSGSSPSLAWVSRVTHYTVERAADLVTFFFSDCVKMCWL